MRTIKFRVRDYDSKLLIGYEVVNPRTGQWEHLRLNRTEWLIGNITDGQIALKLQREQYTGLRDSSGRDIYEGDVVKFSEGVGKVVYDTKEARFCIYESDDYSFILRKACEVMGDIYNSKHLLRWM